MVAKSVPSFDPNPSLNAAVGFLHEIGVTAFALIGRVATWLYLPEDVHQFTKGVDVAVLTADISKIEQGLKAKGYTVYQLPMQSGGWTKKPACLSISDGLSKGILNACNTVFMGVEMLSNLSNSMTRWKVWKLHLIA